MSIGTFFLLLAFAATLLGSPGPATISLAASGAAYGWLRSLPFLFGILIGFSFDLLVAAIGLATLFAHYPIVQEIFKYISGVYIILLAWKIFKSDSMSTKAVRSPSFINGVVLDLLNPKAYIVAISIFTQFTSTDGNRILEIVIISTTCMLTAAVLQFAWVYGGAFLGRIFSSQSSAKKLNIAMAIVMVISVIHTIIFID